ncbi:hypothetical protein ACFL59_06770 [Planctomycetota bacterium]
MGADWSDSLGFYGGTSVSESTYIGSIDDYQQVTTAAGARITLGDWWGSLGFAWVAASHDSVDGTRVFLASVGTRQGMWGGALSASASVYPEARVLQLDPGVQVHPFEWLSLGLGPSFTLVRDDLYQDGGTELLAALRAGATVSLSDHLTVSLSGFFGRERYRVEASGLSVWTGSERYTGGYGLACTATPLPHLTIALGFEHRFADEQYGWDSDFQSLGGTLSVQVTF